MVQFRVLILMTAVIINLSSCITFKQSSSIKNCKNIVFNDKNKSVTLNEEEYLLIINPSGYDLKVLKNEKIIELKTLIDPLIQFCDTNKESFAKGNNIFSSSLPENTDYFYSIDNDKKIIFFAGNLINLKKKVNE